MSSSTQRQPLFAELVFNPQGQAAEVAFVGDEACYVILDGDFRRHVEAETIDRQVLLALHEQIVDHKEIVTQGVLNMLGQDDLFTKAMIDSSIENFEQQLDQLLQQGLPPDARTWLGLMGFRVIVDVHGEVLQIESPVGMAGLDDE